MSGNTYTFPEQKCSTPINPYGCLCRNIETGEEIIFPKPIYEDGDVFYWMRVDGQSNLPWEEYIEPLFPLYVTHNYVETFAKTEEELKYRLEYIMNSNKTIIDGPIKYRQIQSVYTTNSGIDIMGKLSTRSINLLCNKRYEEVIIPISFTPLKLENNLSNQGIPLDHFKLDRTFDFYYDFENVDYFTTQISPDHKIPPDIFTKNTPWILKKVSYVDLIVHLKDISKPVRYKVSMVYIQNPKYAHIKDHRQSITYPLFEYPGDGTIFFKGCHY